MSDVIAEFQVKKEQSDFRQTALREGYSLLSTRHHAGTSVSNIESIYGHWDTEMKKTAAMKNFAITPSGIVVK